jgi:hypothetical protein
VSGCRWEEGVLGAVYMGEEERPDALDSIPYLPILIEAHNSQSSRLRVFYCKGNLAVPRKSLRSSKGGSKDEYIVGIYT